MHFYIFCQIREIELSPARQLDFRLFRLGRKSHFFGISALSPARERDVLHFHVFHVLCKIIKIELSPTRKLDFRLSIGAKKMCIPSVSALSPARELDSLHFH